MFKRANIGTMRVEEMLKASELRCILGGKDNDACA
jgi:hypothetical protein